MRYSILIACLCLLPLRGDGAQKSSNHEQVVAVKAAKVFAPAIAQIQDKTKIPILLPSKLTWLDDPKVIKFAWGEIRDHGYFISLYYDKATSNASYAAGFGASAKIYRDLGERGVKLANGVVAHFSPVSCGGSCAPANLWWEQNGVQYQIQIKLGSTEKEEVQERVLVETANSCVLVSQK